MLHLLLYNINHRRPFSYQTLVTDHHTYLVYIATTMPDSKTPPSEIDSPDPMLLGPPSPTVPAKRCGDNDSVSDNSKDNRRSLFVKKQKTDTWPRLMRTNKKTFSSNVPAVPDDSDFHLRPTDTRGPALPAAVPPQVPTLTPSPEPVYTPPPPPHTEPSGFAPSPSTDVGGEEEAGDGDAMTDIDPDSGELCEYIDDDAAEQADELDYRQQEMFARLEGLEERAEAAVAAVEKKLALQANLEKLGAAAAEHFGDNELLANLLACVPPMMEEVRANVRAMAQRMDGLETYLKERMWEVEKRQEEYYTELMDANDLMSSELDLMQEDVEAELASWKEEKSEISESLSSVREDVETLKHDAITTEIKMTEHARDIQDIKRDLLTARNK
ncbi:hypothetical protein GGR52DRAFT_175637 [Hypoxylon sp. FL1284]|nr:hypothetical protein GGR52DRAFT_175637 [Hypoxylon sp. FL1284]